jgi:hypothetical protein
MRLSTKQGDQDFRWKAYKPEPVYVWMCLHEVIDVSMYHPLRYHRKLSFGHCHPYQWQHVLMQQNLPRHDLLAEPLYKASSAHRRIKGELPATHASYLLQVTVCVRSQNFYRNVPTTMYPLPHIRKPTPVQGHTRSVITNGGLQGSRKKCMAATHPVQQSEGFLSGMWGKIRPVQRLVDRRCRC